MPLSWYSPAEAVGPDIGRSTPILMVSTPAGGGVVLFPDGGEDVLFPDGGEDVLFPDEGEGEPAEGGDALFPPPHAAREANIARVSKIANSFIFILILLK